MLNSALNVAKGKAWTPVFVQFRNSQYSPNFIKPIYKRDELEKLVEEGGHKAIAYTPIRAAKSDQHTSVFRDDLLNKFINIVMEKGKKRLSRTIVEKGLENVKCIQIEKYHKASPEVRHTIECNPIKIFHQALENCKPMLELTPIKRGAIVYQVPIPMTERRSTFLAMKWLMDATNDKDRKIHFPQKFAWELVDAYNNVGRVVKRKQELHRLCEANKAYAHFRW